MKELMNVSEKEKLTVPFCHLPLSFHIAKYLMLAADLIYSSLQEFKS